MYSSKEEEPALSRGAGGQERSLVSFVAALEGNRGEREEGKVKGQCFPSPTFEAVAFLACAPPGWAAFQHSPAMDIGPCNFKQVFHTEQGDFVFFSCLFFPSHPASWEVSRMPREEHCS